MGKKRQKGTDQADLNEKAGEDKIAETVSTEETSPDDHPTVSPTDFSFENVTQVKADPTPGKPGRKKVRATLILSELKTQKDKPVKQEYVREHLIRAEKKLSRQFEAGKETMSQLERRTPAGEYYWGQLEALYQDNKELFNAMSPTYSGPATDGKCKRVTKAEHKSFNKAYCQSFYSALEVRKFHFYFVLLLYGEEVIDPKNLCKKLKVKCCSTGKHTPACVATWERVRKYVLVDIIKELGLEPYTERHFLDLENGQDFDVFRGSGIYEVLMKLETAEFEEAFFKKSFGSV